MLDNASPVFFLFGTCSEFEATKGQYERPYKYLFIKHIKERIESLREKNVHINTK